MGEGIEVVTCRCGNVVVASQDGTGYWAKCQKCGGWYSPEMGIWDYGEAE